MTICRQALSVVLSFSVTFSVIGLDGCKKSEQAESNQGQQQNQQGQAPATTNAVPSADQLYQLVAPIALFPDNLLAQVLAASTFPNEVTEAYNWVQQNPNLKGEQLMQAANNQPWDPSVKGLTQFSDVLSQMATNLSWTSALGDAYFNYPSSVMNAVQVMRQRAQASGSLKSNQQQTVSVQNQAPGSTPAPPSSAAVQDQSANAPAPQQTVIVQPPPQTIIIQPAQPDVVYVPAYNPTVVYGAPVPAYPGYSTGAMVATSLLSFGVGIAVGAAISNNSCCGWGWNSWNCGWHNNTVVYNHNTYISNSNTFVNRNNFNNRNVNVNNVNRNNVNVNNVNRNNVNASNINRNNVNANNRTNNFSNYSQPHFNQSYNQPQFRNTNAESLAQQHGATQGNLNQQNRVGGGQNQARPANFNQNQRQPERGYGQQGTRGEGHSAFGNYGQGGNARTNSARGQQSLGGGRSGGFKGRR